ncbi:MAG UNVERIFIED_CONTAM: alkaline phosphatase D family protein [Planctomycetaceae bacterium]
MVVWDDHEFDNNFAGAISEEQGVDSAEFLLRRSNAWQAWYEHMPVRRSCLPRGADLTLNRTIHFGRLACIEMLDTRPYRTDQPNGDRLKPLTGGALDPAGMLLGETQERWLMRQLLVQPLAGMCLAKSTAIGLTMLWWLHLLHGDARSVEERFPRGGIRRSPRCSRGDTSIVCGGERSAGC